MKLLLDIQDSKASHILALLEDLPYIKTKQLTNEKAELMTEIREAVDNLNLVKKGKLKAIPIRNILNEL